MCASVQSRFLVTSQLMQCFSASVPKPGSRRPERVVYVAGAWDMFHVEHVNFLRRARALGDHLIVGVLSDGLVNRHKGSNHPVMAMNERVLSVLGCQYVDDVLLDAPWAVTQEMVATLRISTVVQRG